MSRRCPWGPLAYRAATYPRSVSNETKSRYDEIADFYAGAVGDDTGDEVSVALFELVGPVVGMRVLDLACGHGRVSRELARRGAAVMGADISSELLEKARRIEESEKLGITYVHEDVTSAEAFAGEYFGGVVSHFGLSDIDDLGGVLGTVVRVLSPDGWFVFSILHPCFPGRGADAPSSWPPGLGYYEERWWLATNPGFRGKVGANHRMLSTYLNGLVHHRLAIERVAEPAPSADWIAEANADPMPVYLVVRSRRMRD
jgi:ubiquinone/menaquinone biosynthesis C-methylase UbiE